MPQGLQLWDASGNLMLDTSMGIGRHTGTQDIGPGTGTISVPGYASPANVWYIATASVTLGHPSSLATYGEGYFGVSGGDISWDTEEPMKIVYGVY